MTRSAIAASGLRKTFKDKTVLDGIDLDVRAGTVFSLLGPNGAGKTTTVNVLSTLMLAITYGLSATSMAVNFDMTKGIINRFKVMDISRGAVLNAQVIASFWPRGGNRSASPVRRCGWSSR